MKTFVLRLFRLLYGFRAFNLQALKTPGPVLLLPNHVSWLDWLLIGIWLEDDWRFVTSIETAGISWLHHLIMVNRRTFPVNMNSPYAMKHIAEYLRRGGRLVVFPEGRLSRTGSLMKLLEGTGFLILKTNTRVITAYIRNGHRLPCSPNPARRQWFPRVTVHFGNPLSAPQMDQIKSLKARATLMERVRDQMARQQFETEMEFGPATLPAAIAQAAHLQPRKAVLQDATMRKLSYSRLLASASVLAAEWRSLLGRESLRIGVLLPNVNAQAATLLSLWAANRTPAILNYSSGVASMLACARLAGLKQVITSKAFVARANIDLASLEAAGVEFIFLEALRERIPFRRKFVAGLSTVLGWIDLPDPCRSDDTAVVLFTSGSEAEPKGVELTHRNLLANIRQMLASADLLETDRFFNALPLFHTFGLTVGLLLPLIQGAFVFLYAWPLRYRMVPALFYQLDCTIFFGTNTLLAGYGRGAHAYDFRSLRYVFSGGEKLQAETIRLWMNKFGARILEGYGATECSPCLTVNRPIDPREGSVGQFLPGVEHRLEPVEGINSDATGRSARGESDKLAFPTGTHDQVDAIEPVAHGGAPLHKDVGRLFVRGPNVMRGYVNPEANVSFKALDGWYDTGDIAEVDAHGYVFIVGRLKRFAKVSGEMVSLMAVEDAVARAFSHYGQKFSVAVMARPDEDKGEKLIVVTNEPRLTLDQVREALRQRGFSNLATPRELKLVPDLPKLATGKVDYRELSKKI